MLLSINIDKKLLLITIAILVALIVLYFLFQRVFLSNQVVKAKGKFKITKKQKKYDIEYIREVCGKSRKYNNTFKKLSNKAKKLVKEFFKRYNRILIDYIFIIQSKKNPSHRHLQILVKNQSKNNKIVYKWREKKGVKGFIKMTNKYKILDELMGFLFELDENIEVYDKRKNDNNLAIEAENYIITYRLARR